MEATASDRATDIFIRINFDGWIKINRMETVRRRPSNKGNHHKITVP
jgi:hypothetical protein